jgi:hypothetical protein
LGGAILPKHCELMGLMVRLTGLEPATHGLGNPSRCKFNCNAIKDLLKIDQFTASIVFPRISAYQEARLGKDRQRHSR